MKIFRNFVIMAAMALASHVALQAQSTNFKTGKALEVQYNILRELSVGFVDTLDIEKLTNTGIEAMLNSLDPYTIYIPEENEEDLADLAMLDGEEMPEGCEEENKGD